MSGRLAAATDIATLPRLEQLPKPRRAQAAPRRRLARHNPQLLVWLCGVLLVTLTMSRHWVICRHHDGDAHLTLQHGEAHQQPHRGCACQHHRSSSSSDGNVSEPHVSNPQCGAQPARGKNAATPHEACSHTDLLIELGHEREAAPGALPVLLAMQPALGPTLSMRWRWPAATTCSPPATGPPRPRTFWSLRATTLLLI